MAVGRIKEIVVRKGEGFGVSNVMKITLSADHRSVDGAVGAAFMQTFKKYLENPGDARYQAFLKKANLPP